MDLLMLDEGDIEIRTCPYIGATELKHALSGKTACLSAWHRPNQAELIRAGNKLLIEVERDRQEKARRSYFWLGAEAEAL
jgi:hypothetical protein